MEKNENNKGKWIILSVVVMMSFMSCLDTSIVNIALPVMSKKLSVTMASIEWVAASYIMIICSSLLIFGRLGDIKGKTRIFKFGMVVFTIGSFLCGMAVSLPMLILFRIVQGIGASAYMANNQGIIAQVFSNHDRGKALGILAAAVALGTMVGPPAGGIIVSYLGWNYIFFINVPIGLVAFLFAVKILPKGKSSNEKFDSKGAVLFFAATILLFGALIKEQELGYQNPIILASFLFAVICMIIFIRQEHKIDMPLLQLKIFRNSIFSLSLFCAFISFICINASIIILPFYLQDTLKISPSLAGIFMMISPFMITVVSPAAGALSDKIGSEFITFLGLLFMSAGFALMSTLNGTSSFVNIAVCLVIIAFGQGLFQPANNSLIMSAVPPDKLGIAGSVNSLVRNLGQMIGIILSTSLLYHFMSSRIGYRVIDYVLGRDDVFIYAMKHVYFILVLICLIGAILTIFRLYRSKSKNRQSGCQRGST